MYVAHMPKSTHPTAEEIAYISAKRAIELRENGFHLVALKDHVSLVRVSGRVIRTHGRYETGPTRETRREALRKLFRDYEAINAAEAQRHREAGVAHG